MQNDLRLVQWNGLARFTPNLMYKVQIALELVIKRSHYGCMGVTK